MIVDGRGIAQRIYAEIAPFFRDHRARLGIVVVGDNPVIESFVRIKTRAAEELGVTMDRVDVPASGTQQEIIAAIGQLAARNDAVIAQLPLPAGVDTDAVLSALPPECDVDALSPLVDDDARAVRAPVALAVVEILQRSGIEIEGRRAVVIGAGRLVGAPTAKLLKQLGAQVSMVTLQEGSIEDLKHADIVVSGAGRPGLVEPRHLKPGVALIDAGTSELNKKVVGDADPACAEVASVFTPVPGGVGPVAVAMIFRNLRVLIERGR
jgi:methylenetetrahydrofolate dehydrogenase (NADP+)/methenyltetrahydrofolate cyclohydrolase